MTKRQEFVGLALVAVLVMLRLYDEFDSDGISLAMLRWPVAIAAPAVFAAFRPPPRNDTRSMWLTAAGVLAASLTAAASWLVDEVSYLGSTIFQSSM